MGDRRMSTEYSIAQLHELRHLSLELGFMDDVQHWDQLIAKTTNHENRSREEP